MAQLAFKRDSERKIKSKETLTVPESLGVLAEGYRKFQERSLPSSLGGVSFIRIAGQAAGLDHEGSRSEIRRILNATKPGGAFLILAHGGIIPCGGVGAKQKQIELAKQGKELEEPEEIRELVKNISPDVAGKGTPQAELINAIFQARKILDDLEFGRMIAEKNMTMVVGLVSEKPVEYISINREWGSNELIHRHPKLLSLATQLDKGLRKILSEGIDLGYHYAHAIMVYDPLQMRRVLDPFEPYLDVCGISCVDARLQPNTPDGYKYLFRPGPNQNFGVSLENNGAGVKFSYDDLGSIMYALRHVNGVDSMNPHGGKGNGHIVCLGTSVSASMAIRDALLADGMVAQATGDGSGLTLASFDGKALRISNEAHGINEEQEYKPKHGILGK